MRHKHHLIYPFPILENSVKHFWSVKDDCKNVKEKLVPLGTVELLYVEKPFRQTNENGETRELKGWVLSGQRTTAMSIQSIDAIDVFGLRFNPWGGLYELIKIPLDEFKDTIISLPEIAPQLSKELDNVVMDTQNYFERCIRVQNSLMKKLCDNLKVIPIIKHTLYEIKAKENFSVLEHAANIGISHKNLNRMFKKFTGLTVKDYHKIYRIKKTITNLNNLINVKNINFAEIAILNGFFDQSHLIKEFKFFTGSTPLEYMFEYTNDKSEIFEYL